MTQKIVIVDYGMGNLRSVAQAVQHAAPDRTVIVTDDPAQVRSAPRVILPGQGAMPDCMRFLREAGMQDAVLDVVAKGTPLFGVCVGEQMLFDHSDEGDVPGLGLLTGNVERFPGGLWAADGSRLKVPHMGWNRVYRSAEHAEHLMFAGVPDGAWFYFVHSYFVAPERPSDIAASSDYGVRFTCAVAHRNIFATQFHPEKSAHDGLQIYRNFAHWSP